MGLAVLPSRLKSEIALMEDAILSGTSFDDVPDIQKHKDWFERFADCYEFTPENTEGILKTEIGKTFVNVLKDAGVYKDNECGRAAFLKFTKALGATLI